MPAAAPFKHIVLCSTDDFASGKNEKIQTWVEANGGQFTKEITSDVTHLLATRTAFKCNINVVKQAKNRKKIKIVTFDWLEDSLLTKSRKPLKSMRYEHGQTKLKRHTIRMTPQTNGISNRGQSSSPESSISSWLLQLPESSKSSSHPSSNSCSQKGARKVEEDAKLTEIEKYGVSLDIVANQSELDELKSGYHLYRDSTGFTYSINLVRRDILTKCLERHRMKVRYAPVPFSTTTACSSFNQDPAPIPIFYFPRPSPFSAYPCIRSQLPSRLNYRRNPTLCVPIFNPWAQNVQILESDSCPHTYTAFSKYIDCNGIIRTIEIARPGSALDTTILLFKLYFKNRCAKIEWDDRHMAVGKGGEYGGDGTSEAWYYDLTQEDEPKGLKQLSRDLKPCVTMVLDQELAGSVIDARTVTPEGGW